MTSRGIWIATLFVGALLVPQVASAELHDHARNGWTLGFNLGGGSAGLSLGGSSAGDREAGATGNFRVGYAFNQSTVLGLEGSLWTREQNGTTVTFSVTGPAVTFYPNADGFYVRGGVGLGTIEAAQGSSSGSQDGYGFLAAAGYEWRLARTLSLGPQVDFAWMDVGDEIVGNFFGFSAALNWYWGSPR